MKRTYGATQRSNNEDVTNYGSALRLSKHSGIGGPGAGSVALSLRHNDQLNKSKASGMRESSSNSFTAQNDNLLSKLK